MERTVRHRINISRGMAGKISWDATVEVTTLDDRTLRNFDDHERTFVLALSDKLVQELDNRYPSEGK